MDNDDAPVGRILSRRKLMLAFGSAGAALLVGCGDDDNPSSASTPGTTPTGSSASPSVTGTQAAGTTPAANATETVLDCVVSPELTEGPYFVESDEPINRVDIRSDPGSGTLVEGAELRLSLGVFQSGGNTCTPLENVRVDIWHCDAAGQYSGVSDPGFNTAGELWLRGYQTTDASGKVNFVTIYPGWYEGRATHIHFKVRGYIDSRSYEFTSQFFFDEAMTNLVHVQDPYAAKGTRTLLNDGDQIYNQSGGQTILDVANFGGVYMATFNIGMELA